MYNVCDLRMSMTLLNTIPGLELYKNNYHILRDQILKIDLILTTTFLSGVLVSSLWMTVRHHTFIK